MYLIYVLFFKPRTWNSLYHPRLARQSLEEKGIGPTPGGLNRPVKSSLLRYKQSKSEYFIHIFAQPSGDKLPV